MNNGITSDFLQTQNEMVPHHLWIQEYVQRYFSSFGTIQTNISFQVIVNPPPRKNRRCIHECGHHWYDIFVPTCCMR